MKRSTALVVAACVSLAGVTSTATANATQSAIQVSSSSGSSVSEQDSTILRYGVTSKKEAEECQRLINSDGPRPDVAGWPFCSPKVITQQEYDQARLSQIPLIGTILGLLNKLFGFSS